MNALIVAVGAAWGSLAGAGVLTRRSRVEARARLGVRRRGPARGRIALRVPSILRSFRAGRRTRREAALLDRDLPAVLDLLVVAMGAGATPPRAVALAARWAPEPVAAPLRQVLVTTELGGSFLDALDMLRNDRSGFAPVAEVLGASARLGAPAAAALSRLAEETRAAARRRAEARARVLPVKLLFPLVFLVLPAFGVLTVVPALLSAMHRL